MQQLETDLNFISSLPDNPAMATADLKREFDKAGNVIKTYINETLIVDIEALQSTISASVTSQINTAITQIQVEMSTLQTTLEGEITTLQTNVNSQLSEMDTRITTIAGQVSQISTQTFNGTVSNMGDSTYVINLSPSIPSGYKYLSATFTAFSGITNDTPSVVGFHPRNRQDYS